MNKELLINKFDSFQEGTKEVVETVQEKTNEFHENYVSDVVPYCGKYGDAAKFVAEMAPGVGEYNAVRDGDWQAFAIAAGIDVAAVGVSFFTAGAGYAAVKGGSAAAKAGVKVATKEIAEAGAKKATKEITEAGKEIAEFGAEKVEKKAVKEVGDKMDKSKIPNYLKEVEEITGREIKPKQMKEFKKGLDKQDFVKLDSDVAKLHRKLFDSTRSKLIDEWEVKVGEKWPVYQKDILSETGEVLREKGTRLDAHHLIESSFGGPNEWWNLHPAAFPSEHQGGIHGADKLARELF